MRSRFPGLFDRMSARHRRPDLPALLAALDLRPGLRAVDAGGGTGAVAALLHAARPACAWIVAEPDPGRAAFGRGAHPELTFARAVAQALPLRSGTIDRALVCVALHHMPDQAAALGELFRALRPGGRLVVLELDPGHPPGTWIAWLEERVPHAGTHFLRPAELQRKLEEAGFAEVRFAPTRRGYIAGAHRP